MRGLRPLVGLGCITLLCAAMLGCGPRSTPIPGPAADAPVASSTAPTPPAPRCEPTLDDGVSPSYKPGAPVRSKVGNGHVLTGTVLSSRDCAPIADAKLELWPEYPGRGHADDARATVFTDASGRYRFECDPPDHIHMRVSAPGYTTIGQNSYHPEGRPEGTFGIVLVPTSP